MNRELIYQSSQADEVVYRFALPILTSLVLFVFFGGMLLALVSSNLWGGVVATIVAFPLFFVALWYLVIRLIVYFKKVKIYSDKIVIGNRIILWDTVSSIRMNSFSFILITFCDGEKLIILSRHREGRHSIFRGECKLLTRLLDLRSGANPSLTSYTNIEVNNTPRS